MAEKKRPTKTIVIKGRQTKPSSVRGNVGFATKNDIIGPRTKASPLSGGLDFATRYPTNNYLLVKELGKLRSRILEDKASKVQMVQVSNLLKSFPS